jgi:hypothetical protein
VSLVAVALEPELEEAFVPLVAVGPAAASPEVPAAGVATPELSDTGVGVGAGAEGAPMSHEASPRASTMIASKVRIFGLVMECKCTPFKRSRFPRGIDKCAAMIAAPKLIITQPLRFFLEASFPRQPQKGEGLLS